MSANEDTSEKSKVATQCAKCHRAVFTIHVNADGVCVLCAPATELDDDGLGRHPVSSTRRRKGRKS